VAKSAEEIASEAVRKVIARYELTNAADGSLPLERLAAEITAEIGVAVGKLMARELRKIRKERKRMRAVVEQLITPAPPGPKTPPAVRGFTGLDASRFAPVLAGKTQEPARNGHGPQARGIPVWHPERHYPGGN
jgi:hypothetical protein